MPTLDGLLPLRLLTQQPRPEIAQAFVGWIGLDTGCQERVTGFGAAQPLPELENLNHHSGNLA
jgi:hypothetical protein